MKKTIYFIISTIIIVTTIIVVIIAIDHQNEEQQIYEVVFEEVHIFSADDLIKISESKKYQGATLSEKKVCLRPCWML